MATSDSYVQGTVLYPDSKEQLAEILVRAGFAVTVGQWSLRLEGCARAFHLRHVGNITPEAPFDVEGDGHDVAVGEVAECCERLARCLREHRIGYDFLHVARGDEVIGEYSYG